MKPTSEFLAESSSDLKQKVSKAQSADELVKLIADAGYQANANTLSEAMRTAAGAELQKRGFPQWAINSMLLGEAVCW